VGQLDAISMVELVTKTIQARDYNLKGSGIKEKRFKEKVVGGGNCRYKKVLQNPLKYTLDRSRSYKAKRRRPHATYTRRVLMTWRKYSGAGGGDLRREA